MTAFPRVLWPEAANDPVWSRPMHILVSALYSIVVWLALLAWVVIAGGPWGLVLAGGPFVISGLVVLVTAFHWGWCRQRR